jgi:hypothetical protein
MKVYSLKVWTSKLDPRIACITSNKEKILEVSENLPRNIGVEINSWELFENFDDINSVVWGIKAYIQEKESNETSIG